MRQIDRLARVRAGMEKLGVSQILVTETESVYYLTGLYVRPGERLFALLVDARGETLFVNRMFALSGVAGDLPLAEFDDVDDPVALLAASVAPGLLGVDKAWPSHFAIRLMAARRDVTLVVGSKPVDDARMCKDAAELEAMRASSRLNDEAVGALRGTLVSGERERDVVRRYADLAQGLGAGGASFSPLVCFGVNCAEPHHASDDTRLADGQTVILDLGLELNHAMSDMTRTVFFGAPTDEMRRVYDVVLAANRAGEQAVRPGVPLCEIDRAARRVIEDAGYGPYFIHRTGHGIGLSVHEPPDVSQNSPYVAQPGMVFSIEPGIYLPGRFGVRIEDLVAVTEDGCEVLNKLDKTP